MKIHNFHEIYPSVIFPHCFSMCAGCKTVGKITCFSFTYLPVIKHQAHTCYTPLESLESPVYNNTKYIKI